MKYIFIAILLFPSWVVAQWSRVPDIPDNRFVTSLLVVHDTLYAAADSNFYIGAGNGTDWFPKASPVTNPDGVSSLLKLRGDLFAGTFSSGVFRSTNEGASWQPFSNGLSGLGATDISAVRVRRDSLIVGTLGAGVFSTSVDFSHSWLPLGDSLSVYQGDNVFKMVIAGNTVLASAGANGYMFRYTDAQPWWNPIPINNPRRVGQVAVGMASDGNTVIAVTNAGVYRSSDEGLTWELTSLVLSRSTVQAFILFQQSTVFVLAMTPFSSSLYSSSDDGVSWKPLGEFAFANVFDAAIAGDTFFLGRTDGLWKAPLSQLVTSINELAGVTTEFRLFQNYPNPFNPTTKISFHIPVSEKVSLRIFDVLGREIRTLVNGFLATGQHDVQFDASGLSSGIYFYRLEAGNFSATRRLVLIK